MKEDSESSQIHIVIDRIADAIEKETIDLKNCNNIDYRLHNQRKNQFFIEIKRMETSLSKFKNNKKIQKSIKNLIKKIEDNEFILRAKLNAAKTITEIVIKTIKDAQSDGTYSERIWCED